MAWKMQTIDFVYHLTDFCERSVENDGNNDQHSYKTTFIILKGRLSLQRNVF